MKPRVPPYLASKNADHKPSHNVSGRLAEMTALFNAGRHDAALALGHRLLKKDKRNPVLHNMMGVLQFQTAAPAAARMSFERAVRLDPGFADGFYNLGNLCRAQGDHDAAEKAFRTAIDLAPEMVGAHQNMGNLCADLGRSDEAIAHYQRVLALVPDHLDVLNNCGLAFEAVGDFDASRSCYERALDVKPDFAIAHRNLSLVKRYSKGDTQIAVMETLLTRTDLSASSRCHLHFALGRALTQLNAHDTAFAHLAEGNRIRASELQQNAREEEALGRMILDRFATFDATQIVDATPPSSQRPVLIVGMPRSGTSLVEQILASHSCVFGAGERAELAALCQPHVAGPKADAALRKGTFAKIGQGYRTALAALSPSAAVVCDKMPVNFRYVGFALAAMPDARVVWVVRDPVATCWSIYQSYFFSTGNGFAYDFDSIASQYAQHEMLMRRWQTLFADRILRLDYDVLTENQEKQTRHLLDFVGVPFEKACLDFHKTERSVRTLSSTQVRQKLYQGSSQKWRPFEAHLGPLFAALAAHRVAVD